MEGEIRKLICQSLFIYYDYTGDEYAHHVKYSSPLSLLINKSFA
jgi:hypothetical protein